MKKTVSIASILLMTASLMAADSDSLTAAAKKLAASDSYSWKTTTENAAPAGGGGGPGGGGPGGPGGGGRFRQGPVDGKTDKSGFTLVTYTMGDNSTQIALKGTNGVIKTQDADWQTVADASKDDGGGGFNPGRMMAMRVQNFKSPASETEDLIAQLKDVKEADGVFTGALSPEAVKQRMAFGRPGGGGGGFPGGGGGPEITDAKGSAKIWVKDGAISKVEVNVQGKMDFGGNTRDINRTTTTEIKDVGTTKVEIPDAAKKKLS